MSATPYISSPQRGLAKRAPSVRSMRAPATPAQTIGPWLRDNLKDTNGTTLGALTGQDWAALRAAVEILACFNRSDSENEPHCLTAFRAMVLCMQPQCREFAYHAIAHVGDWNMRGIIWARAACPLLSSPARRCNSE